MAGSVDYLARLNHNRRLTINIELDILVVNLFVGIHLDNEIADMYVGCWWDAVASVKVSENKKSRSLGKNENMHRSALAWRLGRKSRHARPIPGRGDGKR